MKETKIKKQIFYGITLIGFAVSIIREAVLSKKTTVEYLASMNTVADLVGRYGIINLIRVAMRAPKNLNFSDSGIQLFKNVYFPKVQKKYLSTVIEFTNNCPYDCDGCYIDSEQRKNDYFMPESLLRETISSLQNHAFILIAGGEPIRKSSADYLYNVLKDYPDQAFILVTTGVYISQHGVGDFGNLNNIVWSISINGMENINDEFRFKGSHKHAIQAMRNIRKAQQYFLATTTLSRKNAEDATSDEFVNMLSAEGVKEIKYLILRDPESEHQLSMREVEHYKEKTKKFNHLLFTTFTIHEADGYKIIDPYGSIRLDRTGRDQLIPA